MSRDVVLSIRVTEEEAEFIRWRAGATGTDVSTQIRQALARVPAYAVMAEPVEVRRQVGWECAHASVTAVRSGELLPAPRLPCGCQMRPAFADRKSQAS